MFKKQSLLKLSAMTILAGILAGPAVASDYAFLKVGTASMGGNFFPMGAAISEVLGSRIKGSQFTPMATGGSAYNMGALERKELDLAISQGTAVAAAINGTGSFEGAATKEVMAIGQYHATPQHIVYSSKIKAQSLQDLKGKSIEMIAPGDGIEVATRKMLSAVGISLDDIKIQHSGNRQQAASRLKTGRVDVIFDGTGIGSAWLVDVIGKGKFNVLSLSKDEDSSITSKYPEFSETTIPANSYVGQGEDVTAVANWTVILVRKDIPADMVYQITKNLFENTAELTERHHYFKDLKLENIKGGMPAELHPGAVKYYKEKGVL